MLSIFESTFGIIDFDEFPVLVNPNTAARRIGAYHVFASGSWGITVILGSWLGL